LNFLVFIGSVIELVLFNHAFAADDADDADDADKEADLRGCSKEAVVSERRTRREETSSCMSVRRTRRIARSCSR
jgi:hypothetical protein